MALAGTGKHVHFAEGGCPGPHVAGLQCALNRRGVSDSDLFERLVHDGLHGCTQPNRRGVMERLPLGATLSVYWAAIQRAIDGQASFKVRDPMNSPI